MFSLQSSLWNQVCHANGYLAPRWRAGNYSQDFFGQQSKSILQATGLSCPTPTCGSGALLRLSCSLTAEGALPLPGRAHLTPPESREHPTPPGPAAALKGGTAHGNLHMFSGELHKVKLLLPTCSEDDATKNTTGFCHSHVRQRVVLTGSLQKEERTTAQLLAGIHSSPPAGQLLHRVPTVTPGRLPAAHRQPRDAWSPLCLPWGQRASS